MTTATSTNMRTQNFRNRLQIEREVLQVVNNEEALPQLSGLTAAAIDTWFLSASQSRPDNDVTGVKAILVMIARVTGTISDNSRAIVSEEDVGDIRLDLLSSLRDRVALFNRSVC